MNKVITLYLAGSKFHSKPVPKILTYFGGNSPEFEKFNGATPIPIVSGFINSSERTFTKTPLYSVFAVKQVSRVEITSLRNLHLLCFENEFSVSEHDDVTIFKCNLSLCLDKCCTLAAFILN